MDKDEQIALLQEQLNAAQDSARYWHDAFLGAEMRGHGSLPDKEHADWAVDYYRTVVVPELELEHSLRQTAEIDTEGV